MLNASSTRPLAGATAALLACSLLLSACGGDAGGSSSTEAASSTTTTTSASGGGLSVSVTPSEAQAGELVAASVVNDTDKQFNYGAAYELKRQGPDGYEKVGLPPRRPVIAIGYLAPPGETGPPVKVKLPSDLEPGTYRVVIQRNVPGVGDLSGQFTITGG